jgi:phage/plasmid-associated DNA primase
MTPPTLAISKTPCFLDNLVLGERFPVGRATALKNSTLLGDVWDEKNYAQKYSSQHHANQIQQIVAYLGNYNSPKQMFQVKYVRAKDGFGRAFVSKSLGLTAFGKKTRNTFIKDLYYDFDLSNAHPAIIKNICEAHNIPCNIINQYIDDRENILSDIMKTYDVSRSSAKKLMLRLCFFGSVQEWKKENDINVQHDLPFLQMFKQQLESIALYVKEHNKDLYETCRKKKEAKSQKNFLGSFFSTYLQEHETQIVSAVLEWMVKYTTLTKVEGCDIPIATYEFDGIKLLKENVDKIGKEVVLQQLIDQTYKLTGFKLNWEIKPIESYFDIDEDSIENDKCIDEMTGVFNDKEAAEKLFKLYPYWKYCNRELYAFNNKTGMWSTDKVIHDDIISQHTKYLFVATLDKDSNPIISKIKSYGNTESLRNKLHSYIKTLCCDDNWMKEKQYSSLGKLLFKNGYFDAKQGKFFNEFNPDVVFFAQIPHDFQEFADEDMEYMADVKQRIFCNPLGEQQGEFLITNLARGLMGDMMKRFLMGLGGSNCGKSIMTTAISLACGSYVGSFNAENLAYRNSSDDEAKSLRWALLLRNKRLIFSNEMKTKSILNGNMIKKLASGGDTLIGRTHGGEEDEFITHFLPVCFANDLPKIEPYDDAVDNRLRFVSFKKEFVEIPTNEFQLQKDENIEQEIRTLRFQRVLVGLFIQSYMGIIDNGVPDEPMDVIMAKEEWAGDDKDPLNKILNDFEVTNNPEDFVESGELQDYLTSNKIDMTMKKFGTLLKKYCVLKKLENVETKDKKVKGKTKKVWVGVKRIQDVEDDN